MGNENTCIRCGKPCAPSVVMCTDCTQWLQAQTEHAEPTPAAAPSFGFTRREENQAPVRLPAEDAVPAEDPASAAEESAPAEQPAAAEEPSAVPAEQPAVTFTMPAELQGEEPETKTCRHCGADILTISRFCSYCGGDQESETVPMKKKTDTQAQKKAEKKNKSKSASTTTIVLAVIVILLALLLIGGAVLLLMELRDDPNDGIGDSAQNSGETGDLGIFEPGEGVTVPEKPEPEAPVVPEVPEEPEEPEKPAAVACRKCGVAIASDAATCPYCEWDQAQDPAAVPEDKPLEAALGSRSDLDERSSSLTVNKTNESSMISQSGSHNNSAAATRDGKLETSWQEGVSGYGIGEWLSYDLGGTRNVQAIRLWLGNWREGNWYSENGVPKTLEITVGEETITVEFPYGKTEQWVILSEPVKAEGVKLEVVDAYSGSKYQDTCIAEIEIYGWAD